MTKQSDGGKIECFNCEGIGFLVSRLFKCEVCNGKGFITRTKWTVRRLKKLIKRLNQ